MTVPKLRNLIPDLADGASPPVLRDDQLQDCLSLYPESFPLALATALELIASSELLMHRVIRTQELQIDSGALADRLLARAATLRSSVSVVL